jgi:hypothetical protein
MTFETTDFEDVLREACEEVDLDPENLSAQDFRAMRRYAKKRLEVAWEYHFWPTLGTVEQRFFRPAWSATTTYQQAALSATGTLQDNSANEVFYAPTQLYYLSLAPNNLNNPPADINGNTDNAHWAVAYVGCFNANFGLGATGGWPAIFPVYAAQTWDPTVAYVQGNQVGYAGQMYQMYAAAAAAGDLPTDTANWGLLVPFDAYVSYTQTNQTAIGIVQAAYTADPRTTTRGHEVNWDLSERGVQVHTPCPFIWLDYRGRCVKLGGEIWNGEAAYAAGAMMYYSSASTPGNFYTAASGTAAGQSPDTAPNVWTVVAIPRLFHKYLVLGMAADYMKAGLGSGLNQFQGSQGQLLLNLAQTALDDQKSLLVGQQGQRIKTVVQTR